MRKGIPNINHIATDIVTLVNKPMYSGLFDDNVELIKSHLINYRLELDDHDGLFVSRLDAIEENQEAFDKAYKICQEYIVEYQEQNELAVDRNEGLCFKDVE